MDTCRWNTIVDKRCHKHTIVGSPSQRVNYLTARVGHPLNCHRFHSINVCVNQMDHPHRGLMVDGCNLTESSDVKVDR